MVLRLADGNRNQAVSPKDNRLNPYVVLKNLVGQNPPVEIFQRSSRDQFKLLPNSRDLRPASKINCRAGGHAGNEAKPRRNRDLQHSGPRLVEIHKMFCPCVQGFFLRTKVRHRFPRNF